MNDGRNVLGDELLGDLLEAVGRGDLVGHVHDLEGVPAGQRFGDLGFAELDQVHQVELVSDDEKF